MAIPSSSWNVFFVWIVPGSGAGFGPSLPLCRCASLCFAFALQLQRGTGEKHPAHLTAEPAAPSRGDTGFSSPICYKLNMCSLKHTFSINLDYLPFVARIQLLALLSLRSLAEVAAELVQLKLLPPLG